MSILISLVIGGLIGWAAAYIGGRDTGILMSVLLGIAGSVVGGLLSMLVTGADNAFLGFSWAGVFWSFLGALLVVGIMNMMQRHTHHHA